MVNKLNDAFDDLNNLNKKSNKSETISEIIERTTSKTRFKRNKDPDRKKDEGFSFSKAKNFAPYRPVSAAIKSNLTPTPEQEGIINSQARRLKIVAFAGAGKTSTLIQYANKRSRGRGLYIAFNKDIKTEAMSKLPSNVKCMTSHGLAYSQFGVPLAHKLNIPLRWGMVYEATGIEMEGKITKPYARLLLKTVANFIASADEFIDQSHIAQGDYKLMSANSNLQGYLPNLSWVVIHAEKLWQAMISPDNLHIGATHDCYLKLMQLSSPELPYDYILLDEAQDSNPAILDIVSKHKGIQVLVGDPHQSIYSFRKSIDAMTNTQADESFSLTGSFRFGPEIADFANTLLAMKGETNSIVGLGESGVVYNGNAMMGQGKSAYISRSNSGLFKEMVNSVGVNKSIYISGGLNGVRFDLLEDLYHMQGSSVAPRDPLLSTFSSFSEFQQVAQDNQDVEWISRCKIIEEFGTSPVFLSKLEAIKNRSVNSMSQADQVFSTAHKSKGLQFDHVTLADDFIKAPATLNAYSRFAKEDEFEEVNILYVASTRAVKSLNIRKTHEAYWKMISPMLSPVYPSEERAKRSMAFPGDVNAHFDKIALQRSLNVFYAEQKEKEIQSLNDNNIDIDPFEKAVEPIRKPRQRL